MRRLLRACAAIAFGFPMPALAAPEVSAVLTQIQGTVLVDAGEGFAAVSEDVRLKLGDRVLVTKEGGAILSYGANCSLPLQAPSMTVVEETACTTATQGTADENNRRFCGRTGDEEADRRRNTACAAFFVIPASIAVAAILGAVIGDDGEEPESP